MVKYFTILFYRSCFKYKICVLTITVLGWCISAVGIGQLLIWGIYTSCRGEDLTYGQRLKTACKPLSLWGPLDATNLKEYKLFIEDNKSHTLRRKGFWFKVYDNIFG